MSYALEAVALGPQTLIYMSEQGVAVGSRAIVYRPRGIAIGGNAREYGTGGVAIGNSALVSDVTDAIALGMGATASAT